MSTPDHTSQRPGSAAPRRRAASNGKARLAGRAPPTPLPSPALSLARPRVAGKFLFVGEEKLYVKGVTYGTFRPDEQGRQLPDRERVEHDFAVMAEHGINAVRTYTVPDRWFLDAAARHGLRVMVGLPWEQHLAFLEDLERARSIVRRVAAGARAVAGHPAVLCLLIGNEIPAPIVRWYGRRRIERFIRRLYHATKAEDPEALVTYANYPSTEYLDLSFLDFACFNVYLESPDRLRAYLARLHNLAGDRPLVMAEMGLDSRRHGRATQAASLDFQVRAAFAAGCAGAFVFAWTDEWHRGGHDVADWDFGLTDRGRRPKPALDAVRNAFSDVPFPPMMRWPRVSVVVCTYNGGRTLVDCFEGLRRLRYPNHEVIVVDDGSTDPSAALRARDHGFTLIRTPNRGLSCARNTGWQAASGEIVAYLDDDARPDPDWLTYLAAHFMSGEDVGVGGPNLSPPGEGWIPDCVANAPGGPVHVLLSDTEAEHLPGCNMAFRRAALEAIGGFDPQFRQAGDDVDVCWRLRERGGTLGFSPAAVVWHHRRPSVRAYWRQQRGYGRAEALLEAKWPERYNPVGQVTWSGRIYGTGLSRTYGRRARVYHGIWGSGPFQRLYEPAPGLLAVLAQMPEWQLVVAMLAGATLLGAFWAPLLLAALPLAVAITAPVARGAASVRAAGFRRRALTTFLQLAGPLARLRGRQGQGLTPWRLRSRGGLSLPRRRAATLWCERWRDLPARLASVERWLRAAGVAVRHGGEFDPWDLEVRGGLLASARLRATIEEHGDGRQLVRLRVRPRSSPLGIASLCVTATLAALAAVDSVWIACGVLAAAAVAIAAGSVRELAASAGSLARAIPAAGDDDPPGAER